MPRKPPTSRQAAEAHARKQRAKARETQPKRRSSKADPASAERAYQAALELRGQLRIPGTG